MMEPNIKTYRFPDGSLQRVQTLTLPNWEDLNFLETQDGSNPIHCFGEIFRKYMIPSCPWLFGNLVLFQLPQGLAVPFSRSTRYGVVADDLTAAAAGLRRGLRFRGGKPCFRDNETEHFYRTLEAQDCLRVDSGKLPITTILPIGDEFGLLSECRREAAVKVNASFFIMDPFDCATVFDHVGACLGLMVKDGVVRNPPLYGREALLVRRDGVTVEPIDIRDLPVEIGDTVYRNGENCHIFTRPRRPMVGGRGTKLVIVGTRVVAVCHGRAPIPASGYVLCPKGECTVKPGDTVSYPALADVLFGIQVGNSILRDGVLTDSFRSKFYNIRRFQPVPYPPSMYPLDFQNDRAARMALGADAQGRPMLLWAEGAPKDGYVHGTHSRGASLSDMGQFCRDAGMHNAVNLDGGGSAQLLVHNRRSLERSDAAERYLPNGLIVERM